MGPKQFRKLLNDTIASGACRAVDVAADSGYSERQVLRWCAGGWPKNPKGRAKIIAYLERLK